MRNTLTIARFTLQEAVSRRLILAGVLLSLIFLGLYALGFGFLYANVNRAPSRDGTPFLPVFGSVLTVMGLYAVYFLSSFLALFLSVGAVSAEVDSGALHAVLAHPLRRAEFIVGRWLAYAGMLGAYVASMVALLLLVARLISGYEAPDLVRTAALMTLGALLLLTLSLLGSTRLSTLANGVVVFSLFGLAWMVGIIEFIGNAIANEAMVNLGITISLLVPSDAIWRGASYYVQSPIFLATINTASSRIGIPFASTTPPTLSLVLWAGAYALVLLGLAVWSFRQRDL